MTVLIESTVSVPGDDYQMVDNSALRQLAAKGFGWNLAGSFVRYGAGFLINIILARLLGPEPYGLVALAMIVISIANLIVDSGLNSALVQKISLEKEDIHFVFTTQIALGVVIYLLIAISAPLIGQLFRQPELVPVLRILTLAIVFQSASQTSLGLLKRKLAFKIIQRAQVYSYLIGYLLIGVPLAILGKGIWSLVVAELSKSAINLFLVYFNSRHSINIQLNDPNGLSKFGLKILGVNIANWIISSMDGALIGRYFGPNILGLYNRSMSLAFTPIGIIVSASQPVLFSASSRIQDSFEAVRKEFLIVFTIFGLILVPFAVFISLNADNFVEVVYGSEWIQAGPILAILSLAFPFYAFMAIEGPLLAGVGKPEQEFKIQWIIAIIDITALITAVQFTLQVVLWTVFGIYVIRFLLMSVVTIKIFQVKGVDFAKSILASIIQTIGIILIFIALRMIFVNFPVAIELLIQAISATLVWIVIFILVGKRIIHPETLQFIIGLTPVNKICNFIIGVAKT